MDHRVAYKVYDEDTDSLGVVYYANYLKYLERGYNREGFYFVVYALTMKFKKAATLGDMVIGS